MANNGLGDRVRALIEARIRPVVLERGGDLALKQVADGIVELEFSGSPGAALAIRRNIANLLRHYISEITDVRIVTAALDADPDAPPAERVQRLLDDQINPAVNAHNGHIELVEVRDGSAFLRLEGGCQGCAMAHVTMRQGIEVMIKQQVPEIVAVVDVTDHTSGTEPYFKTKKGAD